MRLFSPFQGSLGANAFLIWEMSATDPSRKWSFRRSLPQLGTALQIMDFVRLSALENRMGELKVRPGQFRYYNSTHFRTRTSTKNTKMWSFWGLINPQDFIKCFENRQFSQKENGGGDFWTADNKKVKKTKSMKKSAPPPQGRDAFFWKNIKVFSEMNVFSTREPTDF